jgi:hypothetical protein
LLASQPNADCAGAFGLARDILSVTRPVASFASWVCHVAMVWFDALGS